jgi:hypothetical protein
MTNKQSELNNAIEAIKERDLKIAELNSRLKN